MINVSERAKVLYLILLSVFVIVAGIFWLDYIGLLDIGRMVRIVYSSDAEPVLNAKDDEPSLIEKEEFEKEKQKLLERIEELDKREAHIVEAEKALQAEKEKYDEMKKGLDLEKRRLDNEKARNAGYEKNVKDLARKVVSIPPRQAVLIMVKWEEPLIIDVLRQIDADAAEAGKASMSSYLISLMPQDKASRIMYLMTQI